MPEILFWFVGGFPQPQDKPVDVSGQFLDNLKDQYASMYLEALGAQPTTSNMCDETIFSVVVVSTLLVVCMLAASMCWSKYR